MSIYLWSTTAASNGTADPTVNFAEGQSPASLNDSSRAVMARIAAWVDDIGGVNTVGGTGNAITVALLSSVTSYANGLVFAFRAVADNTAAVTLSVNSIGAIAVRKITQSGEAALSAGDIKSGGIYILRYESTANSGAGAFIILNPTPSAISANSLTPSVLAFGPWTTAASAATVDLGAQTSRNIVITGTTTITSFGTTSTGDNIPYLLRFAGILTLTNGSNLILPTGANITTAAGDVATVVWEGSNVWRVVSYQRASGRAVSTTVDTATTGTNTTQIASTAFVQQELAAAPLATFFESSEQSMTLGGTITVAHGLGARPKLTRLILKCTTADSPYNVGDEIELGHDHTINEGGQRGFAVYYTDTTNINVVVGSSGAIPVIAPGGSYLTITLSSWRLIIRAWR